MVTIPVHRFASFSEVCDFLNPHRQVRHWSFGITHTDNILVVAERFLGTHAVPVLAAQHGVRHVFVEPFVEDLPRAFIADLKRALRGTPRYLARIFSRPPSCRELETIRRALRTGRASSEIFLRYYSAMEAPLNRGEAGLIAGLCAIEPAIAIYGGIPSLSNAAAAEGGQGAAVVTRNLRSTSETVLQADAAMVALHGAGHNANPQFRSRWEIARLAELTVMTPEFVQRFGAETCCNQSWSRLFGQAVMFPK